MFEDIYFCQAKALIEADIKANTLPSSVIFLGEHATAKLLCALEVARVLSCKEEVKGKEDCQCPSCKKMRALTAENLLLLGSSDCNFEIKMMASVYLKDRGEESQKALLKSIRKLTLRFNGVLWDTERLRDKANKSAVILNDITDLIDELASGADNKKVDRTPKVIEKLLSACQKLEDECLYSSIPVDAVRCASDWARTSSNSHKTIIFQNADLLQDEARNSMLKILEEPPPDTTFILTATKKARVIPTILSRCRVYNFNTRNLSEQQKIIAKVFSSAEGAKSAKSIRSLLLSYCAISPKEINLKARDFVTISLKGQVQKVADLVKSLGSLKSSAIREIFFVNIIAYLRNLALKGEAQLALSYSLIHCITDSMVSMEIYNLSPTGALEDLSDKIYSSFREYNVTP